MRPDKSSRSPLFRLALAGACLTQTPDVCEYVATEGTVLMGDPDDIRARLCVEAQKAMAHPNNGPWHDLKLIEDHLGCFADVTERAQLVGGIVSAEYLEGTPTPHFMQVAVEACDGGKEVAPQTECHPLRLQAAGRYAKVAKGEEAFAISDYEQAIQYKQAAGDLVGAQALQSECFDWAVGKGETSLGYLYGKLTNPSLEQSKAYLFALNDLKQNKDQSVDLLGDLLKIARLSEILSSDASAKAFVVELLLDPREYERAKKLAQFAGIPLLDLAEACEKKGNLVTAAMFYTGVDEDKAQALWMELGALENLNREEQLEKAEKLVGEGKLIEAGEIYVLLEEKAKAKKVFQEAFDGFVEADECGSAYNLYLKRNSLIVVEPGQALSIAEYYERVEFYEGAVFWYKIVGDGDKVEEIDARWAVSLEAKGDYVGAYFHYTSSGQVEKAHALALERATHDFNLYSDGVAGPVFWFSQTELEPHEVDEFLKKFGEKDLFKAVMISRKMAWSEAHPQVTLDYVEKIKNEGASPESIARFVDTLGMAYLGEAAEYWKQASVNAAGKKLWSQALEYGMNAGLLDEELEPYVEEMAEVGNIKPEDFNAKYLGLSPELKKSYAESYYKGQELARFYCENGEPEKGQLIGAWTYFWAEDGGRRAQMEQLNALETGLICSTSSVDRP